MCRQEQGFKMARQTEQAGKVARQTRACCQKREAGRWQLGWWASYGKVDRRVEGWKVAGCQVCTQALV